MNLIGNAVKFTASGSVTVTCSITEARAEAGEICLKFTILCVLNLLEGHGPILNVCRLSCRDTGFGLASSDVDLLFVPFQQADNSSTRQFGGTGLGLSISRQLVKLMGGAIGVKSELKVGSTFWFTIPVKVHSSEETQKVVCVGPNVIRDILIG
jgi:signal transduction histidine kinase